MMKVICILASLLAVLCIPNGNEWLLQQDNVLRAFIYHFFHGNIFHLLANALSLYVIVPRSKVWHLLTAYVIATLSAFVIVSPMIGISNVVYALIGVRSPSFDSKWWKHSGTIIFFVVTILMLFLPNVSGLSHVISFAAGLAVSAIHRSCSKITSDAARYV